MSKEGKEGGREGGTGEPADSPKRRTRRPRALARVTSLGDAVMSPAAGGGRLLGLSDDDDDDVIFPPSFRPTS